MRDPAQINSSESLSQTSPQVDWSDKSNWNCNNNVHPSRHGTYDGISMHPYETVFVKASWHVGHPFIDKYADWAMAQVCCQDGTMQEGRGVSVYLFVDVLLWSHNRRRAKAQLRASLTRRCTVTPSAWKPKMITMWNR